MFDHELMMMMMMMMGEIVERKEGFWEGGWVFCKNRLGQLGLLRINSNDLNTHCLRRLDQQNREPDQIDQL